jgi:hypothetical protein
VRRTDSALKQCLPQKNTKLRDEQRKETIAPSQPKKRIITIKEEKHCDQRKEIIAIKEKIQEGKMTVLNHTMSTRLLIQEPSCVPDDLHGSCMLPLRPFCDSSFLRERRSCEE